MSERSREFRAPPEKPRLKEGFGPELLSSVMVERTSDLLAQLYTKPMSLFDLAHCVMLLEQGIMPESDGRAILAELLDLHKVDPKTVHLDPIVGDILLHREQELIARLGAEVGGRLHTARSRGDTYNGVLPRLAERDLLLDLLDAEIDLGRSLTRLAAEHTETVMPGYSHLQQAQPTTFGHYLLSFAFPILRNLERGLQAYARTNQSPAGSGILAGSGYPVDRARTAELLGFDGVLPNTRDAVWSEDHTLDVVMVANQAMTTITRLAQDLEIWATFEFGMVELADRHSSTSSIMPQKKNPYALEYLRGLTSTVHGSMMTCLSMLKAPSEEIDFMMFQPRVYDMAGQVRRGCIVMARVIDGLTVRADRMAELAGANFTQATDIADIIGIECDLAFRTAHRIVGTLVRLAAERKLRPQDITPALLDEAAIQVIQRPLGFTAEKLAALMDPRALVARRKLVGGPAPERVREQLALAETGLDRFAAAVSERRAAIASAEQHLLARASDLAAGAPIVRPTAL